MCLFCPLTISKRVLKRKEKKAIKMLFKFHSTYGLNGRVTAV